MLKKGWRRIAKNLVQAVLAGVVYSIALREWVPTTWFHIFSSFIVSVIIIINVIDPSKCISVLKRQGVVSVISAIVIIMFYEVMNTIPEQLWWQNAILVSLLGSCFTSKFESMIPYTRQAEDSNCNRIKDMIIAIINSFGLYRALKVLLVDDFLAVLCTSFIIIFTTVNFDKDGQKKEDQKRIAVIVSLISTMLTMFLSLDMNMYISLIIGLGISNPLFTYIFERIISEEKKDTDFEKEDEHNYEDSANEEQAKENSEEPLEDNDN